MTNIEEILMRCVPKTVELPGDYRNDRGLLCCGKCHEPKESLIRFSESGPERRVPVACVCARTEAQAREESQKLEQRREENERRVRFLRDIGIADIPRATFRTDDRRDRSGSDTLTRYCDKFEKALKHNMGLLLYGVPGNGKTFFAECVANELKMRGYFVWMAPVASFASAVVGDSRPTVLSSVRKADLLILDDFDCERKTEYMLSRTYEIIDERYKSGKPLMITTNMNPVEMGCEEKPTLSRIYDRVLSMCTPLKIDGSPRKKEIAQQKLSELKELLAE